MSFYTVLVHTHSILRWALLLFVVLAIILSISRKREGSKAVLTQLKVSLWAMATAHVQLVLGLILYFTSPKVVFNASAMSSSVMRFYLVEHVLVMLIGIALITIGYIKAKKAVDPGKQSRTIIIYFLISLLLILSRIPWPFLGYGGGWL